eukprot:g14403.t1
MSTRRRSSGGEGDADPAGEGGQQKEEAVTNIKVAVRCRPFSISERSRGEKSCFRIENGTACLENPANPADIHRFGFDLLYGGDSKQVSLWRDVGVPAMEKAFAGFNTTIFAYGQTGSGKTYSMQGVGGGSGEGAGIIPRMNEELFARWEIDMGEVIYDLLDPNNRKRKGAGLEIREHGVLGIYVKGLQEMVVTSPDSLQRLIDQGMASRTVGSTAMNDTSSRSHSVFTVKVHQKDATDESKSTFAKINLVDLAGSERAKSTGATGARLKEGANINKSLSSLGNVINALVDVANGKKGVFVPYRNSKLTRVLQESLGGNSLTAMLAALSPAACNFEETLSTLKYASRAKSIKVNAVKNEEASQVSRLEEEVRALKQKLLAQQKQQSQQQAASASSLSLPANVAAAAGGGGDGANSDYGGGGGDRYKQQIAEMEAAMKSTWEEKAKQSESSERERQRLQRQLEEDARREERGRKKRWRALEDKGDLELSIREAKEAALPTLPARDWLGQVRALVAAENRAREEATVCAVYREALARELEGVFSTDSSLAGSSSYPEFVGCDPDDDRASTASTNCATISESGSIARLSTIETKGNPAHQLEVEGLASAGSGGGGGDPRRTNKAVKSYDPALLRQLQIRGREPTADDEGQEGEEGNGETGEAAARKRRWEARKNEGARALAMIRRQVVSRGRRSRQQQKSGSSGSISLRRVLNRVEPATTAAAAVKEGGEETLTGGTTGAPTREAATARAADAETLCPAAVIVARAVEAVLSGSTSAFGGDGESATACRAAKPAPEGLGVDCAPGEKADDTFVDGGEGSKEERDRYRKILEGLGKAHVALGEAIESAADSSCACAATGDDTTAANTKEHEMASALPVDAKELPPVSQWHFRCSWGGAVETDGDKQEENEEENGGLKQTKHDAGWFTWATTATSSGAGGQGCAIDGSGDKYDRGSSPASPRWVEIDFGEVVRVKGLDVCPLTKHTRGQAAGAAGGKRMQAPVSLAGFGEEETDGSIERTEAMIGEVLGGWGGILKSTPPAKLLSRPPVRFLYDLFRAVAKTSGFEEMEKACSSKWEDLSGKKDKIRMMDGMVRLVVDALGLQAPPAKGSDIVVGQECTATNRFLQLLALAAHSHQKRQQQQSQQPQSCGTGDQEEDLRNQVWATQTTAAQARVVAVATSEDGVTWVDMELFRHGGGSGDETADENEKSNRNSDSDRGADTLALTAASPPATRYLRLASPAEGYNVNPIGTTATAKPGNTTLTTATAAAPAAPAFGPDYSTSEHGNESGNTNTNASAFRVRVVGVKHAANGLARGVTGGADGGHGEEDSMQASRKEAQEQSAMGLLLEAMRCAVSSLLEQSMEWGRIEAAHQERKTAIRANKMESLEKRLKASNEAKARLAKDKKSIAAKMARTEEENLQLQEQVLRLRADVGRERVENTSLSERLAQAETRVEEEKAKMRELEGVKRHLDGETEDLQNQVEVLTEERDVARSHEEELFAKLTDRTDDLEALQESYVSLTDRWNDFKDEHDEVLEQLESFRTTFALSNNTSNNNNNDDNDSGRSGSSLRNTTDLGTTRTVPPFPGDVKPSTTGPDASDANLTSSTPSTMSRQQEQEQHRTGGIEGDGPRGGGGASEDASKVARPISGREGRTSRSSNAPPRPESGRNIVARTSSSSSSSIHEDGGAGDSSNGSRNHSWGSPREDGFNKPGSNPSSRRSSPRRPPSSGSSVPSPRYCPSPRTSGSGVSAAAPDPTGLRRRRGTEEWAGGGGWERARGRGDECGYNEEKENQGRLQVFSDENADGSTSAAATTVAAENRSCLLHGGDSGDYEDDFDDCFEDESEGGRQRNEHDVLPARVNNGGEDGDKTICTRDMPLAEVVYRPPSGGSRGKGERPKSAARQGRSASLNGAG